VDQNTELILLKTASPVRWEDEESSTNDPELLREEFRRRLYPVTATKPQTADANGTQNHDAK
jgi:hypothetical protein